MSLVGFYISADNLIKYRQLSEHTQKEIKKELREIFKKRLEEKYNNRNNWDDTKSELPKKIRSS